MPLDRFFHVAISVRDLDSAMAMYGAGLGLVWAQPRSVDAGLGPVRFTYSRQGPPHLELAQELTHGHGSPTSIHHVGQWSDDVATDRDHLVAAGMEVIHDGTAAGKSVVMLGLGGIPLIELIGGDCRAGIERWIDPLPGDRSSVPSHVGISVPDVDRMMSLLGTALGLNWTGWRAADSALGQLRLTYSREGPPYLELVEGVRWGRGSPATIFHIGYWPDDLDADGSRLEAAGFDLIADGRPAGKSYVFLGVGDVPVIELVGSERSDLIKGWIAGGSPPP